MINTAARDLANVETDTLKSHGIGASEQLYATGTALADIGHASLEADDTAYRALPPTATAMADLKELIRKEDRIDFNLNVATMRLNHRGLLAAHCNGVTEDLGFTLEDTAWSQLTATAGERNINAGLTKSRNKPRLVRTRTIHQEPRSAFGLVSADARRGYSICDAPEVADLTMSALKDAGMLSGSRTEITYTAESTRYRMRTVLQAPIDIPSFRGVGRVHQLYLDVTGADNGMASIEGETGAMRVRCLNASKSRAVGSNFKRIHKGDATEIRTMITSLVANFGAVASDMRKVWADASARYYLDPDGGRLSPTEAITRLVYNDLVPSGGLTPEAAIERYTAAWRAEEGVYTADGIIMAIQRAAHEAEWSTKWADTEIEDAASGLLYQPVYTLDEVTA